MKRYGKYVKPYRSAFLLGPVLMIVEVIGEVFLPVFMADIINVGAANRNIPYIVTMGGVMVVTAFIMMLGGIGGAWFSVKAAVGFGSGLRRDLFLKVQDFSFHNIDSFSTGSLVTRLTNDITQVQNVIMMGLRLLLRAPGMLVGAVIMAFLMNAKLAVTFLFVIPLLSLAVFTVIRIAFPRFEWMQKQLDKVNTGIQETLTNIRIIKSFVRGQYEEEKFAEANEELKQAGLRAFNVVIFQMPLVMFFMNVTTLAIVWTGGKQVLAGSMPVGDLTAFTTYIVQILMSLMMLAMVFLQSTRAIASLKRINQVLHTETDLTDENAKCKDAVIQSGDVEFKDVSFSYYKGHDEKVLEHISFRIKSGETVGIVGSTGCGKTSLVQMIPRLYDVDEGQVLVDGIDVRDYSLHHLRNSVGMVLQKNVLFSGTIEENLRWGDEAADIKTIQEAAMQAQAHEFICSFEKGYDTRLEQGGSNLSGGQKQRLCIARALLKKPRILILDDSTSAVDTATEAEIRKSFYTALKDTTKIIIAQRISSVMEADKIIVMEEGKIAGMGRHEELLKDCQAYREIYDSQMEKGVSA